MPIDKTPRFDSRTMPFSTGGAGDRTAGALIPEGPDPLFRVSIDAPDIKGLPWDRRTYDAWTTPEFRVLVLAWLVTMLREDTWMHGWSIREKATQPRLSNLRLEKPLLIISIYDKELQTTWEVATEWTVRERDDTDLAEAQLAVARETFEILHGGMSDDDGAQLFTDDGHPIVHD